jgi:hypothetical protein
MVVTIKTIIAVVVETKKTLSLVAAVVTHKVTRGESLKALSFFILIKCAHAPKPWDR